MGEPPDGADSLRAALEWAEKYLSNVESYPVLSQVEPGSVRRRLPEGPPASAEPFIQILDDVDRIILPGITHWNHPRFFGYFAISAPPAGVASELIMSALNVNAMLWRTSPSATELEEVVCGWLAKMTGLPHRFGTINDTASVSTLHALAAARHRAQPQARREGLSGLPAMTVYCSMEAHSSVDKAALTLGLGTEHVRKVPVDHEFRMKTDELRASIREDRDRGLLPVAVVATSGTTATTGVDPIGDIADVCREEGLWLHVDAAYAGPAAILEEFRWILEGAEHADSIVMNPHKWLFVPIDCSVLFVRERDDLVAAFSVVPDYLRTSTEATNSMDLGVALGRRFRALKLWAVIRSMGVDAIKETIRRHIGLAQSFAGRLRKDPRFEIASPHPFSVVNFRTVEGDAATTALIERVNSRGRVFISSATVLGRPAAHVAIGNYRTSARDVEILWDEIDAVAGELEGYISPR